MIIVDNLHYNLLHSVMWVQQSWVIVIIESTDEEDGSYTIPSYNFLKSNS